MATGLQWIREDAPRWDADKQRPFGPAELAATALAPPEPAAPVADEWWHVADAAGAIVGYGWLDSEWGDAEAAARGLNYIYNVVPATSQNRGWVTAWLAGHGFVAGDGDLRRRVREDVAG